MVIERLHKEMLGVKKFSDRVLDHVNIEYAIVGRQRDCC
jgi:hypothetical protein